MLHFYRWFLFFVTSLFLTGLALYLGVQHAISQNIATMSFVYTIFGLYTILSLWLGYKVYTAEEIITGRTLPKNTHDFPTVTIKREMSSTKFIWFSAYQLIYIGMAGTISGLMIVFQAFYGFDIGNVTKAATMIDHATDGIYVAFWTTLSGLIYTILLKTQLAMVEYL